MTLYTYKLIKHMNITLIKANINNPEKTHKTPQKQAKSTIKTTL